MKKLYLAVTPDEYELPLFVTTSIREMAKFSGRKEKSILGSICHKDSGKICGMRFFRIDVED